MRPIQKLHFPLLWLCFEVSIAAPPSVINPNVADPVIHLAQLEPILNSDEEDAEDDEEDDESEDEFFDEEFDPAAKPLEYSLGFTLSNQTETETGNDREIQLELELAYNLDKHRIALESESDYEKENGEELQNRLQAKLGYTRRILDNLSFSSFYEIDRYQVEQSQHHNRGLGGTYHISEYFDFSIHYVYEVSRQSAFDDEFTDDELTDDELMDDELMDDELTDDELLDDEFTDDIVMNASPASRTTTDSINYELTGSYALTDALSTSFSVDYQETHEQALRQRELSYTIELEYELNEQFSVSFELTANDLRSREPHHDKSYEIQLNFANFN